MTAVQDIFLYGVIIPVIPFSLVERAHVQPHDVQHWVSGLLAVYGAGLLFASPICGWLADRSSSRRLPFLVGLLLLAGSTVMLCVGTSIGILVAGRLLQGASAAIVWTVGLALLVDTVGKGQVGEAMGIVSLSYTTGVLVAPLLGGVVYARSGYYPVFYIGFAIIALDIVLRLALIEKKIAARWLGNSANPASDHSGGALITTGITSTRLSYEATDSPEQASRPTSAGPSTDRMTKYLPPVVTLMKSRRILAAFWGTFVLASLMTAFDSTLPLFVNRVFGWDSLGGGLIFLALIVPTLASPIVGRLCDKYGPRWLAALGFLLALPFWVLLRLVTHKSLEQIVLLCALLTLIGVALALVFCPLMAEFTYIVEAKERQNPGLFGASGAYAQAYGLFNTAWAAGSLIGPLWAGNVRDRAGWGTMTWSLGALSAVSAIPILIYTGGLITRKNRGV